MPSNVILCSNSYIPASGGLVSYLKSFSKHLVNNGSKVDIFTTDSKDLELPEFEIVDGVRVHRCRAFSFSRTLKIITPLLVVLNLTKQIGENIDTYDRADVILVRHIYYAAALLRYPSLLSKSIFVWPLVSWRLQIINARSQKIFRRVYSFLVAFQLFLVERRVARLFPNHAVLSLSKRSEIELEYPNLNTTVIPPGIDETRFRPLGTASEKVEILQSLGREQDIGRPIVLTVCRLVEEKNVASLISAMRRSPQAILYVVGNGPLRNVLEKVAKKNEVETIFWGEREDVEVFYRVSDIFVLASFYEGFGHVYLEAMSSGCACIGVRNSPPHSITATDEIIVPGQNGILSASGSGEHLASAIGRLFQALDSGEYSSENIRTTCLKKYSWNKVLEQIMRSLSLSESAGRGY
jgi:glycosyltransferase involved in cell wall biosynthesis